MLDVAVMIEGQNGLTWERWMQIAQAVEDLGFFGLYRSDHYTNANPPDKESLELWISLAWLASHTERIQFGPLVTPVSFRDPTMTARMARDVDDLSGGRLHLGLGAGWQEREHRNYGWDLLEIQPRFVRFEEGLEVITRLFRQVSPVDYSGDFYQVNDAVLLPRPQRPVGPPIIVGGNGVRRTLPLAARYANEWNGVFLTPERFSRRSTRLDMLLESAGRKPSDVARSVMVGCVFGRDQDELNGKIAARGRTSDELKARGLVVGTTSELVDQLSGLAQVGVDRVMLQWLDLDDLDALEVLAVNLLPQIMS